MRIGFKTRYDHNNHVLESASKNLPRLTLFKITLKLSYHFKYCKNGFDNMHLELYVVIIVYIAAVGLRIYVFIYFLVLLAFIFDGGNKVQL